MLVEIKVKDFAIIDRLNIEFGTGLNILSGETGAGKSVILKTLALLMGEKAVSDVVRHGAETAVIEGFFDLHSRPDVIARIKDMDIDCAEGELVVRRAISSQGKSRVYLNGHLCALHTLRDVVSPLLEIGGQTSPLIEMTGQHESKDLLNKNYHLEILDLYAGTTTLRHQVGELFTQVHQLDSQIKKLQEEAQNKEQRLDYLRFQQKEIRALNLQPGEDIGLEQDYKKAKNLQSLLEFLNGTESALYSAEDSVLERLHRIINAQGGFTYDLHLAQKIETLTQAKGLIEDFVYDLREYQRSLSEQPLNAEVTAERLSQLRKLQKKHGASVEEILKALEEIELEISQLEDFDNHLDKLRDQKSELQKDCTKLAKGLHQRRLNAGQLLTKGVNEELSDLNMKGVGFGIHIEKLENLTSSGYSDVEFMIQNAKGDKFRSIAKVASGGELSRILLALKQITGKDELPRTLLFDEVDTGVSGETAEKVGRKLKSIAQGQQVICVTHLPQVAAFADFHYVIEKGAKGKSVQINVRALTKKEREAEIARLVSGEKITASSRQHARELLKQGV